jgi:hypothetical protein
MTTRPHSHDPAKPRHTLVTPHALARWEHADVHTAATRQTRAVRGVVRARYGFLWRDERHASRCGGRKCRVHVIRQSQRAFVRRYPRAEHGRAYVLETFGQQRAVVVVNLAATTMRERKWPKSTTFGGRTCTTWCSHLINDGNGGFFVATGHIRQQQSKGWVQRRFLHVLFA